MELEKKIFESIIKAQKDELYYEDIYRNISSTPFENEFLFFIKPEITQKSKSINVKSILELIFNSIDKYGLHINNVKVLSAKYLDDNNIIAQHYGVINKLSNNALKSLSDNSKQKFKEIFNKNIAECNVLGGNEFLKKYEVFNPLSLDYLWQNKNNHKLGGGTYCMEIKLDAENIHLINGFHPRQLLHFTEEGKSIVVFTLSGNLDWKVARNDFIGATNPLSANDGSIRKELLKHKEQFGLKEISQGLNGVHLSAGPIEGLIELIRYNSNFSENIKIPIDEFNFGKMLKKHFSDKIIEQILSNPDILMDNKKMSLFDLTEEMNSKDAIGLLKKYLL